MAEEKKVDLGEISGFNKDKLSHAETQEKVHKPDAREYAIDKTLKGIQEFNSKSLKHADTVEKNNLPTKEDIEADKQSNF